MEATIFKSDSPQGHFIQFLTENDCIDHFKANISPRSIDKWLSSTSYFNYVSAAFEWDKSPEGIGYWDEIDKRWWNEIYRKDFPSHADYIEGKQQLIERLLGEKAAKDNSVDLNAYALGLSDMYDKMESIN